ncbi:MAG: DNA gyrase inhibitor YacG [Gammaproteobacteria bacterium]|nr:DNA gyrase inhibitor YacG [Gammaproteobacteria bacterium]
MSPARVKCPTCHRYLDWETAPFRPFCSERCRLIDLGAWLSEQRAIAGDPAQAADPRPSGEEPPRGPPDP